MYMCSNKWAMDAPRLTDFSKNRLVPAEAEKYLCSVVQDEMPQGLKWYMELALSLISTLKSERGSHWLQHGGGYVVKDFGILHTRRACTSMATTVQMLSSIVMTSFCQGLKEYEARLVQYVVGNVKIEAHINPTNFVECRLVLCAHNEMTVQSNDMAQKSWVFDGEHQLRKKGVGRGIHRSDVICSTMGHLVDAGQSLEYGKNYDDYWNGEMFVKQVGTPKYYVFI